MENMTGYILVLILVGFKITTYISDILASLIGIGLLKMNHNPYTITRLVMGSSVTWLIVMLIWKLSYHESLPIPLIIGAIITINIVKYTRKERMLVTVGETIALCLIGLSQAIKLFL